MGNNYAITGSHKKLLRPTVNSHPDNQESNICNTFYGANTGLSTSKHELLIMTNYVRVWVS
jgi:hypothetical protein